MGAAKKFTLAAVIEDFNALIPECMENGELNLPDIRTMMVQKGHNIGVCYPLVKAFRAAYGTPDFWGRCVEEINRIAEHTPDILNGPYLKQR